MRKLLITLLILGIATSAQAKKFGNAEFVGDVIIGDYSMPTVDGTDGYVLTTTGNGTAQWEASAGGGGTPGGSDGDIQYNDGGSFGGFGTYDDSTDTLTVGNINTTEGGQSVLDQGLTVNNLGGDTEQDDFIVNTDLLAPALEIDAGDDYMTVSIPSRFETTVFIGETFTGYSFPTVDGTDGYVLTTTGNGTAQWEAGAGSVDESADYSWTGSHTFSSTVQIDEIDSSAGTTTINNTLEVDSASTYSGVTFTGVTADPCSELGEGAIFYNTTSNYFCYCDGTNDLKMNDNSTACF